ncbi:MAG: SDR family NAD(P)-dependent oxidoreductase, partial [Deltaproteobacteria bacterium]|nr:SDR family NAD(P)-dependent oxidoreductase [Deltaproteobacteria bacterium]
MKVLVTGGAGFIGSNVVLYFLEKGHSAVILDNLSTGYRKNIPDSGRVEFIQGDVRDAETVDKAARDCGAILHLAASVGNLRSLNNPQEDSTVNVIGTLNILEVARKASI